MKSILSASILIVFFCFWANAQKISGKVYDSSTGNPLTDCVIVAQYGDAINVSSFTDDSGTFSFTVIPGTCTISTSSLGFKKYKKEYFINKDENVEIKIFLILDTLSIINPVITTSAIINPQELRMDKDIFMRLPGAFNDPSRLLTRFPTIAITNDQSNQITIKGLAPHTTTWFVNNAPIVNPNHLSNAGTITDQASSSGGGVNMISGTSINSFSFYSAPFNNQFYDSPAGLSNFTLSIPKGFQYSIGLLGTEASYSKDFKSSSIGINYRYSTLGILSALGVNLGDEEINFQDLHIKATKELGNHTLGIDLIAGNSKNYHAPLDIKEVALYKDAQDILFKGNQFLASVNHKVINNSWSFKNTLNYSSRNSFRKASIDTILNIPFFDETRSEITENNLALANSIVFTHNDKLSVEINNQTSFRSIKNSEISTNYFQQYNMISLKYLFQSFRFTGGLGYSHFPNKILNPEIRFGAKYSYNAHNIEFKFSKQANSILPEIYLYDTDLKSFASNNLSLDYYYQQKKSLFQAGVFYNTFSSVPISNTNFISYFDRIDLVINELQMGLIDQNGTAEIVGFQEQFEYLFLSKIQCIQSISIYDISVQEDGKNISSSFDFGYTYAFTVSLNQELSKSRKLLYSLSLQGRGAGNDFNVDLNKSQEQNSTIYFTAEDKETLLNPYFRVDAKIDYIFGKNLQHRLSLDIQNILNRQNDAYQYYDPLTQKIETQNQLGLIPILKFSSKLM